MKAYEPGTEVVLRKTYEAVTRMLRRRSQTE